MLVRLPARMHVPSVELPRLSSLPLPPLSLSSTSILLALLASLVLLATARAALLFLRPKAALAGKPVSVSVVSASDNKSAPPSSLSSPTQQQKRSSWGWGLITWDRLPSLPLSLSAKPVTTEMRGRGVGLRSGPSSMPTQQLQQQQPMQQVQSWQSRRGPAFERPLPAIYQTEVPASMAKMIMSRHTFRRPSSPRPPPRSSTPQVQIQKRTPSMV